MIKLTPEQSEELVRHPDGVECQAAGTAKTYVIVDADVLQKMRTALYRKDAHASIADGIADLEAGRMMTAQEADDRIRSECGFPNRVES